jgi:hypothetical protein
MPPHLVYWLRLQGGGGGVHLTNFLLKRASNHDLPSLCLLSSWNYKCEPPYLAAVPFFKAKISKIL